MIFFPSSGHLVIDQTRQNPHITDSSAAVLPYSLNANLTQI
jgi:hypothetical protein